MSDFLLNLPGPNRFLVIMSFLLIIMFLTYRNMRNRARAESEMQEKLDELQETLDRKNNRIDEIHHRVKNNLQMISSMIGLQADECEDPALTKRMRSCRSRVHSIAMIHDLLNESVEEDEVEVKPYLERLIYKSIQMRIGDSTGVDVQTDIDSMTVDADTATSCGLVVSELLTNCFQHAFEGAEEGRIDVQYARENGSVTLRVSDDGTGFPEQILDGTSNSTGYDIVHSLVESDLDGDVTLTNTDGGAQVRISFPLPENGRNEQIA